MDRRHHHLRLRPVTAFRFVDDSRDAVRREVGGEVFLGLPLQLQPVHEEEDAMGVLGAEIEFGDGRAENADNCVRTMLSSEQQ